MSSIKSFSNLSNRDRSRIRWSRYRDLIIWCLEYKDYDGQWYGQYVTSIGGDECSDNDLAWIHRMIDEWEPDHEDASK